MLRLDEIDHIDAEMSREDVEMLIEREIPLCRSVSAIRAAYGKIRIDRSSDERDVLNLVQERKHFRSAVRENRQSMRPIRPGIHQIIHRKRRYRPIIFEPRFDPNPEGMPRARVHENFFSGEFGDDISSRPEGEERNNRFKKNFLFRPEAPADAGLYHPNPPHGDSRQFADDAPGVERDLCRRYDHQTSVFVKRSAGRMRLHCTMLDVLRVIGALIDVIGACESLLAVSERKEHFSCNVFFRTIRDRKRRIRTVVRVQSWRFRIPRKLGIEKRRQTGILDFQLPCGRFGGFPAFGSHSGNPVTDIQHAFREQSAVVRRGFGIPLPRRGIEAIGSVFVRQDIDNAGNGAGFARVYRQNIGEWIRRIGEGDEKRIAKIDIRRKSACSACQRKSVGFRDGRTDNGRGSPVIHDDRASLPPA